MARMTKESPKEKFAKAEKKVARAGRIYNAAYEELQESRNKMAAIEDKALWVVFTKRNKTLDEALEFS